MSVVQERMILAKNSGIAALASNLDPKASRQPPPQIQLPNSSNTVNGQILDPNSGDNAAGFFGSFFQKKKKPGVLENVRIIDFVVIELFL